MAPRAALDEKRRAREAQLNEPAEADKRLGDKLADIATELDTAE